MKPLLLPAVAALCLMNLSCATAQRTTKDYLYVITEPAGAQVATSIGQSCIAPCTLILPRRSDFDIVITQDGYEPFHGHVTNVPRRSSAAEPVTQAAVDGYAGGVAGFVAAAQTSEAGLTMSGGVGLTSAGGALVLTAAAAGVVIPILVDAHTGANRNLSPNPIIVRLTPAVETAS